MKILDQVADYLSGSLAVETVLGYFPVPVQLLKPPKSTGPA